MSCIYELCGPYRTPKEKAEKERLRVLASERSAQATEAAIAEWRTLPQEERDRRIAEASKPRPRRMTTKAKAYLEAQQAEDLRQLQARDADATP